MSSHILSAYELFALMNHPVLSAKLINKLDKCWLIHVSAGNIFSATKSIEATFPLQHWHTPSKYTAYRDARLVQSKVCPNIVYSISLRVYNEYKIAIISRIKGTRPPHSIAQMAADRWPVNNRILAEWIEAQPTISQLKEVVISNDTI